MKLIYLILLASLTSMTFAGSFEISICYSGCSGLVCSCFAAAGYIFGRVSARRIAAIPTLDACNYAYRKCFSKCVEAAQYNEYDDDY